MLMGVSADDPEGHARVEAFRQGLHQLGWTDGLNMRIDARYSAGDAERIRGYTAELIALSPDVILASGGTVAGTLLRTTRTVPIVFTQTPDPVGAGLVDTLARPGGNATGFTQFEYGISAKWLELLKEVAPDVKRAAVLRNPAVPGGVGQFAVIQSVASSIGVDVSAVSVNDAREIEPAVVAFARGANRGLIVTASALLVASRDLIIRLAAGHKLPAVYPSRFYVTSGGLISYGPDTIDPHRRAAAYVDRILKGEKPADLPVQAPTKHELVINLQTAKALDLTSPANTSRPRRRGDRMRREWHDKGSQLVVACRKKSNPWRYDDA